MLGLALREGHRRLTADDLATSPAARGCLPRPASGDAYVRDSRRLAAEVLAPFGWSGLRLERCLDAIEHHHRLVPQWSRGVEVELLRRADLVEGTGGLVAFGFPRRRLRRLFRAGPATASI